ncbi:hypothetical protein PENPOL_c010G03014 [Penicillium polonicum]|uniref:Fungal N-terminal domain-containing protein n=1 Tax=Penicillium polonicum TaxID=60169 RepID=A0A1V6NE30_PENPO|nr:hypothetical protein PENPOL_c010G03014 [Penicillium polonicum]
MRHRFSCYQPATVGWSLDYLAQPRMPEATSYNSLEPSNMIFPSTYQLLKRTTNSYVRIQNVNQSIQSLSSDVPLTCATLRELGESLKDGHHVKLGSAEAYPTAQHVLRQCEEVLEQIQTMIKESDCSGKSRWKKATSKLWSVLNEPNVIFLRGNLERLKSTMLLWLVNQIRNKNFPKMLILNIAVAGVSRDARPSDGYEETFPRATYETTD